MADIGRMRHVTSIVAREVQAGHQVAIVVSAMAGTTNQLVRWVEEASPMHDPREYDTVVSTGEQVTAGLGWALKTSNKSEIAGRFHDSTPNKSLELYPRSLSFVIVEVMFGK